MLTGYLDMKLKDFLAGKHDSFQGTGKENSTK